MQTALNLLIVIAVMQAIFWNEDDFSIISDCKNSFNSKFKKLISKRNIFYSPTNIMFSSEESLEIKHLDHHTFVGMCSLLIWCNLLNFCKRRMMKFCQTEMLCNFIEITLRHGCSPVNLLHIFKTPVPRKALEGCF